MTVMSGMTVSVFAGLVRLSDEDGCVDFDSWGKLAEEVGVPRGSFWHGYEPLKVHGAVKHLSSYELRMRDERTETSHRLELVPTPEFRVISKLAQQPVGYQVDLEGNYEAAWPKWLDDHFEVENALGILQPFIEEGVVKVDKTEGKKVYQTLALQSA